MCFISGIISKKKDKNNVLDAIRISAGMTDRGRECFGFTDGKKFDSGKKLEDFSRHKTDIALVHGRLAITGEGCMPVPSDKKDFWLAHNGEIYNYRELGANLKTRHNWKTTTDSEFLLHFLEDVIRRKKVDLIKAIKLSMPLINGEYAFVILDKKNDRLIGFNDPLGTKPLWYGESADYFGIASEAMALRRANLHFPRPLKPGEIVEITRDKVKIHRGFDIDKFKTHVPKETKFEVFRESFDNAISLRCAGVKKAGVLFSGGVDSSLVAKAVAKHVDEVVLFTTGVKGSNDFCVAEKAAKDMGLKLEKIIIDEKNIKDYILKTMKVLGEFDQMQVGIGLPIYAACKRAHEMKLKVLFSGQGSDEIFAGYNTYMNVLKDRGTDDVHEEIWSAIKNLWSRNLIRDDLVSAKNMVEVRLPLLDLGFLAEAMAIPAKDKILKHDDPLRKHPIRRLAREYSVPEYVCSRKKEALQYGSGVQKLINKALK